MKKFDINSLLLFPFIIIPFLVTHKFQDPTLLIKRTSLFFILLLIAILFLIVKVKINYVGKIHKMVFCGIMIFIGYLFLVARFNSINVVESYWGMLYLCGWLGVYGLFVLFANQDIMKQIIFTS